MTKEQQTERLTKRNLARAARRPVPPRDLKLDGNILSWAEPMDKRDVTHYIVRSASDVDNIRFKVPVGVTQVAAAIGDSRFFVTSYNEATDVESEVQYVTSSTGKVGLSYSLNGITVEILNGYDSKLTSHMGIKISRDADADERMLLGPGGMYLMDAQDDFRIYFDTSAGGSYLGLYDDGGNPKATLFVVGNTNRDARLTMGGDTAYIELTGESGKLKLSGDTDPEVNLGSGMAILLKDGLSFYASADRGPGGVARVQITDDGVFIKDASANNRVYLDASGGGSYLGLYDDSGNPKATLFVVNNGNRDSRLTLNGDTAYIELPGYAPVIKIGGNQVLSVRNSMSALPTLSTGVTTIATISGTADGTYSLTEQNMLNAAATDILSLTFDVGSLAGDVAALATWVRALETKLGTAFGGHGMVSFT